jgi:hypothetical protein
MTLMKVTVDKIQPCFLLHITGFVNDSCPTSKQKPPFCHAKVIGKVYITYTIQNTQMSIKISYQLQVTHRDITIPQ